MKGASHTLVFPIIRTNICSTSKEELKLNNDYFYDIVKFDHSEHGLFGSEDELLGKKKTSWLKNTAVPFVFFLLLRSAW